MSERKLIRPLVLSTLLFLSQGSAQADHSVARVPMTSVDSHSGTFTAPLGSCGGSVKMSRKGSGVEIWITGADACNNVQVKDAQGKVIFPKSSIPIDPALRSRVPADRAHAFIEPALYLPQAPPKSLNFDLNGTTFNGLGPPPGGPAASIVVRSNSGNVTDVIAVPGFEAPPSMVVPDAGTPPGGGRGQAQRRAD